MKLRNDIINNPQEAVGARAGASSGGRSWGKNRFGPEETVVWSSGRNTSHKRCFVACSTLPWLRSLSTLSSCRSLLFIQIASCRFRVFLDTGLITLDSLDQPLLSPVATTLCSRGYGDLDAHACAVSYRFYSRLAQCMLVF